mmetsp:Transcript_35708/g.83592  ORF Transcript_35708/g.83592 Transcript_35708/m.83592 type:complete len:200 (+) Transcript_35708:295-894(+)
MASLRYLEASLRCSFSASSLARPLWILARIKSLEQSSDRCSLALFMSTISRYRAREATFSPSVDARYCSRTVWLFSPFEASSCFQAVTFSRLASATLDRFSAHFLASFSLWSFTFSTMSTFACVAACRAFVSFSNVSMQAFSRSASCSLRLSSTRCIFCMKRALLSSEAFKASSRCLPFQASSSRPLSSTCSYLCSLDS